MNAAKNVSPPAVSDSSRNRSRRYARLLGAVTLLLAPVLALNAHGDYYVVVGSFLDESVATSELHRRSDRSGNTLRIAVTDIGSETYYRLISGPFVNPRTALSEQLGWQTVGVSDAWVVQLANVPARRKHLELEIARN